MKNFKVLKIESQSKKFFMFQIFWKNENQIKSCFNLFIIDTISAKIIGFLQDEYRFVSLMIKS